MPLTTDYSVRILVIKKKKPGYLHKGIPTIIMCYYSWPKMPTDIYNQLRSTEYSQPVYPQLRAMGLGGLGSVTGLAHLNRAIMEVRGERKRPEERNSDIRSNYIFK